MTRKTQLVLTAAVMLTGLAIAIPFWLTHNTTPPVADTPSQTPSAPASSAQQPPAPLDPQALAEVREAYQKVMAEGAPPGMTELLQGGGQPPVHDPLVTPARFNPGPATDLPPLPPELASRPELLPPPNESSTAPPGDLPPLPPK